jgi:hypothetical protein
MRLNSLVPREGVRLLSSGNPKRIARRYANKAIGRVSLASGSDRSGEMDQGRGSFGQAADWAAKSLGGKSHSVL